MFSQKTLHRQTEGFQSSTVNFLDTNNGEQPKFLPSAHLLTTCCTHVVQTMIYCCRYNFVGWSWHACLCMVLLYVSFLMAYVGEQYLVLFLEKCLLSDLLESKYLI